MGCSQFVPRLSPRAAQSQADTLVGVYATVCRPRLPAALRRATKLILKLYLLHADWVLGSADLLVVQQTLQDDAQARRINPVIRRRCKEMLEHAPDVAGVRTDVTETLHALLELATVERHLRAVAFEACDALSFVTTDAPAMLACDPPPARYARAHPGDCDERTDKPALERAASGAGGAAQAPSEARGDVPVLPDDEASVVLYDVQEVHQRLSQLDIGPAAQGPASLVRHLQAMAKGLARRPLARVTSLAVLDELYERFPHFSDVLDFVRRQLALQMPQGAAGPVRIAPLLLVGEPGVGKTRFCSEMARVLGLTYLERDLSVTSEAFVLSGMDSAWHGAKPGVVYDALIGGRTANPLIALHEVDKVGVERGTRNSPLNALYAALEPHTARTFMDEFVGVRLDASAVVWVLTANSTDLPAPLLSRCEVFRVPQPSQAQSLQVAASVWRDVLSRLPPQHGFPAQLPAELLARLACMTPRQMRRAAERACGTAALQGRAELRQQDFDDAPHVLLNERPRVGFY
jgi:ATP-dependent Lon protease